MSDDINIMIVDDSAVIRRAFENVFNDDKRTNVIAKAGNGQVAIDILKTKKGKINTVTLDIEMPEMDGLTALPKLLEVDPSLKIIIASTLSKKNAAVTLDALRLGATDFITKPSSLSNSNETNNFTDELLRKVLSVNNQDAESQEIQKKTEFIRKQSSGIKSPLIQKNNFDVLTIGSSTGGPQALTSIFKKLKNYRLNVPVFIVQHMPEKFTTMLAEQLSSISNMKVKEAAGGEIVQNGVVYLAPGGFHMTVRSDKTRKVIDLNKDALENFCRPAVDPLLRSVADAYRGSVLTLILTGMGMDGCKGAAAVAQSGGRVIAQDKDSSVVWGMPRAVAEAGICSDILHLDDIDTKILQLIPHKIS